MPLDPQTRDRIQQLLEAHSVLLFMKGEREAPQCGFSATVVAVLDHLIPRYATVDVLSDPALREGVKEFSQWPTIPQLYVRGEFLGGCDLVQEDFASGALHEKLGVSPAPADVSPPDVTLTPDAAQALRDAAKNASGDHGLHLAVDARFRSRLTLAPVSEASLRVATEGLSLHLDPLTATRARGAVIDLVKTRGGQAFQVQLPEAPNRVRAMSVQELARRIDAGDALALYDVRTPEEREAAAIPGSVLVDAEVAGRIEALPSDTLLVFHCHHGHRSQAAAEHFASLGFTNVHNVVGGIDAWSREIDPSVPRY